MKRFTLIQQEINGLSDDAQEYIFELEQAAKDFVEKVDSGRAVSVDSYGKFKKALALVSGSARSKGGMK